MANIYQTLPTHEACSKYFTHVSSLKSLSNHLRWIPFASSVYKRGRNMDWTGLTASEALEFGFNLGRLAPESMHLTRIEK